MTSGFTESAMGVHYKSQGPFVFTVKCLTVNFLVNPVWMKELFFFVVLTDASGVAALVTDYASDEVDDVSCDGLLEINFGECG